MVYIKAYRYMFTHFYQQYLVLLTMVTRNIINNNNNYNVSLSFFRGRLKPFTAVGLQFFSGDKLS